MHKRSSKDLNKTAFSVVQQTTGQTLPTASVRVGYSSGDAPPEPTKNPHAQALGRLGGLKGGKARKAALSAEMRQQIAKKAANVQLEKNKFSESWINSRLQRFFHIISEVEADFDIFSMFVILVITVNRCLQLFAIPNDQLSSIFEG